MAIARGYLRLRTSVAQQRVMRVIRERVSSTYALCNRARFVRAWHGNCVTR